MIHQTFLLGAGIGLILSAINFTLHNFPLAWIELILATSVLIIATNLSKFQSIERAAAYVLSAGAALLITVLFTGGTYHTGLYWFSFFPAVSFFWLGLRRGTYWTLGLLGSAALLTAFSATGWITLAFEPIQTGMSLLSAMVVGIIVFLYERGHAQDSASLQQTIKKLDESRRQAEQLAQAKGDFLANMSHEIRTPLNGVIGMASILQQSPLDESQRECANVIHDSATVLHSLINNVLDFTRMEAGRLRLANLPFNMQMLFEEVTRVIATPAYQKDLEIILDYDEALTSHFMGDKKHLRQIMINLTGNAVKFTPSGHVMLRVKYVSSSKNKDRIYFEVSDTGIGIPENQQRKVFNKFSQADTSAHQTFEGTGLGLAISARLVRMMGGEITLTSKPNKGSTFSFELELETLPGKSVVPAQRLANRRALIVAPYKPLTQILQRQIDILGATTEINNGEGVLEKIMNSNPFDIILLDHRLPDALKLAAAIKNLDRKTKPLIYLLKTPNVVIPSAELNAAGIWAIITKPIIQSELTERLQNPFAADAKPATLRHIKKEHLKVLLVEDNRVNQKVACHLLERLGCKVDLAVNGREAVNSAFSTSYDLIFMDCQMPEMDGYEATRAIRSTEKQTHEPRRVPIIALTAHALDSDRAKCLAVGMDNYLSKPIDLNKLKKIISFYSGITSE